MSRLVAIGVGCRAGVAGEAIAALARRALAEVGEPQGERRMFTLAAKAEEPGLVEAARLLRATLTPLPLEALQGGSGTHPHAFGRGAIAVWRAQYRRSRRARGRRPWRPAARAAHRGRRRDLRHRALLGAPMTVHFIGAGPGAPDLITVRGRDLIARCPVCLYAGSLIPRALLDHCPPGARIVDTAPLDLDAIVALCVEATARGEDVARLHSGDLSIFSAMGEQLRRLERAGVAYTMTPGVPAFAAAAAALKRELTLPGLAQSLVLTRTSGRASPMPERETLANFAATGATLAIHLSIHALERVVAELMPFYGADCPAAVVARASWPDERIVRGTLGELVGALRREPDRAHRAHPRRPGARRGGFSRERTLQRRLRPPFPRRLCARRE